MCHTILLFYRNSRSILFNYDAKQPDELTLRVGNIIKNCEVVEDGWMEGEINGKRGIFPDNFVKEVEVAPPGMKLYHVSFCSVWLIMYGYSQGIIICDP